MTTRTISTPNELVELLEAQEGEPRFGFAFDVGDRHYWIAGLCFGPHDASSPTHYFAELHVLCDPLTAFDRRWPDWWRIRGKGDEPWHGTLSEISIDAFALIRDPRHAVIPARRITAA